MKDLLNIISIVFYVNLIYTQGSFCFLKDPTLCYEVQDFPKSTLTIQKKIQSQDFVIDTHTPIIADMDGDCIPEIISLGPNIDNLLIIDSKTGFLKTKISTYIIYPFCNSFCIADIDNDGKPEIFVIAANFFTNPINIRGRIICYNVNGIISWVSDQRVDLDSNNKITDIFGTPAITDFNQDGIPEIYISNKIFNAQTGVKLADGGKNGLGTEIMPTYHYPSSTIASQLDKDTADLELAAGYTVYKIKIANPFGLTGNNMTPLNLKVGNRYYDGSTVVADINMDGQQDVVVTTPGISGVSLVYAYSLSNNIPILIAKVNPPGIDEAISIAQIGDIKNTGTPSILINRVNKLFSYSFNGTGLLQQDWVLTTTDSSGSIGSTMFDFDNNGINEIVIRDMTSLKIIDGSGTLPKLVGEVECFSHTWNENPIVGSFDSSFHAMICVPCLSSYDQANAKITLFGPPDNLPGWAPARGIWNQYNYNVLNINDDLTVPRVQKNNAKYRNGKYNNFFVQESLLDSNGMYFKKVASLTGKIICINYDPNNNFYTVIFDIYNLANSSFKADSNLPVSFYNGDPTTTGSLIDIYYTLKILENGDSLLNLEFKFSASNLTDLFMVINTTRNGSGQFDPGHFSIAECDYTDNMSRSLDLPKVEKINAAICEGNGYQFYDTLIYDAGVYYHKIISVIGCDSIVYLLEVTTTNSIHINQTVTTCDTYTWNGQTYTQSGTFTHDTTNNFGCDSITTLDLVINSSNAISISQTACNSFSWNGVTYDQSGTYPYQTVNSLGCDSTTTLELIIHLSDTIEIQHETCESYIWNGQTYIQSGTYTYDTTNRFGCDSSVSLQLNINSIINTTVTDAACNSYTWNGQTYTQSGTYQYKTINNKGCDSITTFHLTVNKSSTSSSTITSCDNYSWNGVTYDQSGSYQFQTLNADGCDSIAILQLTVRKSNNSKTDLTICDSYIWNGQTFTMSGIYHYKTQNAAGCDSIAILNLSINKSNDFIIDNTACNSYFWNGSTYTQSGSYQYKTVNSHGCDSIIHLNLTIHKSSKAEIAFTICDSLNFNGQILKSNGDYIFTLQNANGCDSVINLKLNIRSEEHNDSVSQCNSFKWKVNGQTYNQSGFYLEKYTNSFGCDSIQTLNLKIYNSYDLSQQAKACKEFIWPVNNTLLTKSGDYSILLKTFQGCDSLIRLNLIINPDFKKIDTVITNTPYTWPINQEIYSKSGIYHEDFITSEDCDSIHLLYLVIKKDIGIYYPNVINPTGIDRNTKFTLFDNGHTIASIYSLSIYDRWGDLLWQKQHFASNDVSLGWDGKCNGQNVMPGVYVWHAQLLLTDGTTITEKGNVTVVR